MSKKNVWDDVVSEETGGTQIKWSNEDKSPKIGQEFEGLILSHKETPNTRGSGMSHVYQAFTSEGKVFFFATVALQSALEDKVGKIVWIKCVGSHKSNSGNSVHDYEFKSLENTPENRRALGISLLAPTVVPSGDEDEI